uniref:Uncharacterized protein n=1 Tax=Meloidogyne incognita TaxID=6306 RepID=A0A914NL89_MELIC
MKKKGKITKKKKNYKIVANKMKNQMPEAQTIIEEPVVSEEKIIENSSENKSDSSEYYSVNSEYYSANSESEEESPEEFERSLTADQVKNENKGRLKRFYSEQSPPRKKMIEERFEFTPKQDSVGTSGINKIEKGAYRGQLNDGNPIVIHCHLCLPYQNPFACMGGGG